MSRPPRGLPCPNGGLTGGEVLEGLDGEVGEATNAECPGLHLVDAGVSPRASARHPTDAQLQTVVAGDAEGRTAYLMHGGDAVHGDRSSHGSCDDAQHVAGSAQQTAADARKCREGLVPVSVSEQAGGGVEGADGVSVQPTLDGVDEREDQAEQTLGEVESTDVDEWEVDGGPQQPPQQHQH